MSHDDETLPNRPVRRPKWGWMAWEATTGYIAQHHSPDATLKLQIYPMTHVIGWGASLSWGANREAVHDEITFPDALNGLWQTVHQHHEIFQSLQAAIRRPVNYADDEWLDARTNEAFSRLVHLTDTVFQGDWLIFIVYRPVEIPDKRVQARLLADKNRVSRGGNGATLREASRDLYLNAAPIYRRYSSDDEHD